MKRWVASLAVAGLLVAAPLASRGDDELLKSPGSSGSPSTAPASPSAAIVSPAAQRVLADISAAYKQTSAVELTGTVHFEKDMDGAPGQYTDKFHGRFQSPNKFVNEVAGNMIVGSTGQKAYAFPVEDNDYVQKDAPTDRAGAWPGVVWNVLTTQNPSLAMLLSADPATQMIDTAQVLCPPDPEATAKNESKKPPIIELLKPTKFADQDCLTLQLSNDDGVFTFLIDPKTHLVRQISTDQRKYFEKLGHQQVKKAAIVFAYTTANIADKSDDKLFAWAAPNGARELSAPVPAAPVEGASSALVGKPAPDFKLVGLDGKTVKLSEQKGSAVVVDFWATWCGPCVASLPHLNKVYEDHKAAGLKVFAVSVDEDQSKVKPFAESKGLTLHVLFDDDKHETSHNFGVTGIPQTVVIGKDGVVKKVFVGFGPGSEEALTKEVEAALK